MSIASHEFRTPLSTILSSSALIAKYKDNGDLGKVDRHVERIKTSVNHLTMILNDFLSLGKLEEGKVEVHHERIDLNDFMKEVTEEVQASFKEGQEMLVQCDENTHEINSDSSILRSIMFNLISNASKYSGPGKKIYLSCSKHDQEVRFAIKDEGVGIPKEDQKHLFERFFRASNAGNIQGHRPWAEHRKEVCGITRRNNNLHQRIWSGQHVYIKDTYITQMAYEKNPID